MTTCGSPNDSVGHCSHRHYDEDEMGRIALDKNHILVGCTGSVASLLTPRLVEELASLKYNVCETHSQCSLVLGQFLNETAILGDRMEPKPRFLAFLALF